MMMGNLNHTEAACKALLNILADNTIMVGGELSELSRHDLINHFCVFILGKSWDQYLADKDHMQHEMLMYANLVKECRRLKKNDRFIKDVVLFRCRLIYSKSHQLSSVETNKCLDYVERLILGGYYDLVMDNDFHFIAVLSQIAAFYRAYKGYDVKGKSYKGSLVATCPIITGLPFKKLFEGTHPKPLTIKAKSDLLASLKQKDVFVNLAVIDELYSAIGRGVTDLILLPKKK